MNQQDFARHWQLPTDAGLSTDLAQIERDAQQRRRDLYRRDLREGGGQNAASGAGMQKTHRSLR